MSMGLEVSRVKDLGSCVDGSRHGDGDGDGNGDDDGKRAPT